MFGLSKNNISDSLLDKTNLYVFKTLRTPEAGRILALWLMGIGVAIILITFLPWQQNIRGKGVVTAFTPGKRPQTVESAIAGRIASWRVQEGDYVAQGDTILTLSEIKDKFFDPELLLKLKQQMENKSSSIESKMAKSEALRSQIVALRESRLVKLQQARNKIEQAQFKLTSDSIDFQAEQIRYKNAESIFSRNKQLYELGNITLTKFQEVEAKLQESRMKLIGSENKFLQAKAELLNVSVDINGIEAEFTDKISKAESDLNSTLSDIYESQADLAKLSIEYSNMSIRNEQYQVIAPQSGTIVRAMKAGIGETIKEGEAVCTIMPSESDVAVEMYIKAMDVPLVSMGRHVRIEFDGWPALQFSGWPSVAVGTFGGTVRVIDMIDSKNGLFRLLITPDPNDEQWPKQLRVGSGTKGWVMLDDVPIWYEIWRQLNGFPPSLYSEPEDRFKDDDIEKIKSLDKQNDDTK